MDPSPLPEGQDLAELKELVRENHAFSVTHAVYSTEAVLSLLLRLETAVEASKEARHRAEVAEAAAALMAEQRDRLQADLARAREGWLPIVLCPTDGVDRALLLPDGREIVGAFHNPGGWQYTDTLEVDEPVYENRRTGFLSHHDPKPSREPDRVQIGTRKRSIGLTGKLPEGVYPTHFRSNDTVYGDARASEVFTSLSEEKEEGSSRSQPCADAQERSPEAPHSGGGRAAAMAEACRIVGDPNRKATDPTLVLALEFIALSNECARAELGEP